MSHKREMTDAEFRRIKVITTAQSHRAAVVGGPEAKRRLGKFGSLYVIGKYRVWIIDRDGSVTFSGRTGKSA